MENSFERHKVSGVDRFLGLPEDEKEAILSFLEDRFKGEEKLSFEKGHPEELDRLIPVIDGYMREFLGDYDLPPMEFLPHQVHIIDREKIPPKVDERLKKVLEEDYQETLKGITFPHSGIWMFIDYEKGNKLRFLGVLTHEFLHLNSFSSLQKIDNGERNENGIKLTLKSKSGEEKNHTLVYRRSGFSIRTKDGIQYFKDFNEAIITELGIMFDEKYLSRIPELEEDLEERAFFRKEIKTEVGHVGVKEFPEGKDGNKKYTIGPHAFQREREKLNQLIDDLYEKNKDRYSSREEIFAEFVKATMTGRLLSIFRLIEKTYGKGSFRRFAEESKK